MKLTKEKIEELIEKYDSNLDVEQVEEYVNKVVDLYDSELNEAIKNLTISLFLDMNEYKAVYIYDEFLRENSYDTYESNDEDVINDLFATPFEAIQNVDSDNYSAYDDYIQFDGYGKLKSYSANEIIDEATDNDEFIDWLAQQQLETIGGDDEITDLLENQDLLEEAITLYHEE